MARHAHEAGQPDRAAGGYLEAGRRARRAAALDDALVLLDLAGADARTADDTDLQAAVLLERARVNEVRADFAAAERDLMAARDITGPRADLRLRMRMTRMLAGDITVARHRPLPEVIGHSQEGLRLAAELGDAVAESEFRTRLVVLDATQLRLADARSRAEAGRPWRRARRPSPRSWRARWTGSRRSSRTAGTPRHSGSCSTSCVPLLADLRLPWLMQWALLESSLVPAGSSDWPEARRRVDAALEVNRETGYGAYTGFFRAHRGWLARLSGDLEAATDDGRRSVAETSPADHPWWYATAVGSYASTLLELGRREEAAELCAARPGRARRRGRSGVPAPLPGAPRRRHGRGPGRGRPAARRRPGTARAGLGRGCRRVRRGRHRLARRRRARPGSRRRPPAPRGHHPLLAGGARAGRSDDLRRGEPA